MVTLRLREIATTVGGELSGDGEVNIGAVRSIHEAGPGDVTFLLNKNYEKFLSSTQASAVIVPLDVDRAAIAGKNAVIVKDASLAYAQVSRLFEDRRGGCGISPLAFISNTANISQSASIFPYVYIDDGAVVGDEVVVYPFTYVGREVTIDAGSLIYPNVTLYDRVMLGKRVIIHAGAVLGADGFGYVWDGSQHQKIAQLGVLRIEDDVEIGANTCIDRASLDETVVRKGTKIDNLVMIGHNVSIGRNSIIVSQVGIAGSTSVGENVVLGGKVGVADHVAIGNRVRAAGGTGIHKSVPDDSTIAGSPHLPHREWLRQQWYLKKLPALFERLTKIEEELHLRDHNDRD
jgi:UDP-3-O-[3-hydroxymyristoyl] glucosamine N-acyltransferase